MRKVTVKWLIVLLSAAAAFAGDKDKPVFKPGSVTDYPTRQTINQITIAVAPFIDMADTEKAFGKLNPNQYGVLPVLVIIKNDSGKALALDRMKVEFTTLDRETIEPTPAADIRYLASPESPEVSGGPPRLPVHLSRKKNPLDTWEIEGRAFTARMLPPKETASGFFYFRALYSSGAALYFRGIREAASGKELFYFEISLDKTTQ